MLSIYVLPKEVHNFIFNRSLSFCCECFYIHYRLVTFLLQRFSRKIALSFEVPHRGNNVEQVQMWVNAKGLCGLQKTMAHGDCMRCVRKRQEMQLKGHV